MPILLPKITSAQALGESALLYAEHGLRVLPLHDYTQGSCSCQRPDCSSAAKHPRIAGGVTNASADPAQVRQWWAQHPQANIGLATDDIFVPDVDPRHGGIESLHTLIDMHGELDARVVVDTGGGGLHLFYARPPGVEVRNSANQVAPGIDIRGTGGYIVAPPSLHSSGQRYEFDQHGEPGPPPGWLMELILRGPQARSSRGTRRAVGDGPRPAAPSGQAGSGRVGPASRRDVATEKILIEQTEAVAAAADGSRNDTLNRASFTLGQLVGEGRLGEDDVTGRLLAAATTCGLPDGEAQRTVQSGLTAGIEAGAAGDVSDQSLLNEHNDIGNGRRFALDHGNRVRWCEPQRRWLVYHGRHWEPDRVMAIPALSKDTAEDIAAEADPEVKAERDNAKRVLSKAGLTALVDCAKSERGVPVLPEDLDQDPWCLNVENGTLDLRTATLRDHDPADLLSKLAPATFEPDASAPTWDGFLERVVPDPETRSYLQRAVGVSLTGDARSQALFLLYGYGANGKTTFLETIRALLGPYAQQMPRDTISAKRAGGVPNDIARMNGVRFLSLSETNEGVPLDEATVKSLTGGDTISARYLFQEYFDFVPVAKPWLATNHLPQIRGHEEGIWRRLKPVPFIVTIPTPERDGDLPRRLKEELSGVLNWALTGLHDWMSDYDLRPSRQVIAALSEYRHNSDVLGQWIEACLDRDPSATTEAMDLYRAYEAYCADSGLKPMSLPSWSQKMVERGYLKGKDAITRRSLYSGISLRSRPWRYELASAVN